MRIMQVLCLPGIVLMDRAVFNKVVFKYNWSFVVSLVVYKFQCVYFSFSSLRSLCICFVGVR